MPIEEGGTGGVGVVDPGSIVNGYLSDSQLIDVGGGFRIQAGAPAAAWQRMVAAAAADGVTIGLVSAYRTYQEQQALVDDLGLWSPTNPGAAAPGTSNHGLGLAVDVDRRNPGTMDWLNQNAERYGWVANVSNEPWHFEYAPSTGAEPNNPTTSHSHDPSSPNYSRPDAASNVDLEPQGGTIIDYYPPGGQLLDDGDVLVLRYQVDPEVFVEFVVTDEQSLRESGYRPGRASRYRDVPSGAHLVSWQDMGDARVLGSLREGETLADFYQDQAWSYLSPNHPATDDPEIRALVAFAIFTDMPDEEFTNRLVGSDYRNRQSEQANLWNDMSDAERDMQVQDMAFRLASDYFSIIGTRIDVSHSWIQEQALAIASGQIHYTQAIEQVEDWAEGVPESPYNRASREELIRQRQFGVDVEQTHGVLRDLASQWGVQLNDDLLARWANSIEMRENSGEDFERMLEQQARILYPHLPENMTTEEFAAPWVQTLSRVLEVGRPDLLDPRIQQALQSGTNVYEFERQLMMSDDWLNTGNAEEQLGNAFGGIARQLGFA